MITFFSLVQGSQDVCSVIFDYFEFSKQDRANANFLVRFEKNYSPSFFSFRWGDRLSVLYQSNDPQTLAQSHDGRHTRQALEAMGILTPTHD